MHPIVTAMLERIESSRDMQTLAAEVSAALPHASFDDVASAIPLDFCEPSSMPDDASGLIAWSSDHELRFDFERQRVELRERAARGCATG